MDDLRVLGVGRVHGVEAAEGPHRGEAAEDLVARDLPAAVDRGPRVATASSSGMSLPASPCRAQNTSPSAAFSSIQRHESSPASKQVGRDARPVAVHVRGQRGRRCDVAEPPHELRSTRRARGRRHRTRWAPWRAGSPESLSSSQSSSKKRFSRSYTGARSSKRASMSSVSSSGRESGHVRPRLYDRPYLVPVEAGPRGVSVWSRAPDEWPMPGRRCGFRTWFRSWTGPDPSVVAPVRDDGHIAASNRRRTLLQPTPVCFSRQRPAYGCPPRVSPAVSRIVRSAREEPEPWSRPRARRRRAGSPPRRPAARARPHGRARTRRWWR